MRRLMLASLLVLAIGLSGCTAAAPQSSGAPTAKPAVSASSGSAVSTAKPTVDYPKRPITMIVGYAAGGATDLAARIVSAHMEKTLGQAITVENKPGANGALGMTAINQAAKDGYTIGMTSGSIMTIVPHTQELAFDPLEFSYIGSPLEQLYVQLVGADQPWKTVQEMVDWAKANPGKLIHSTSGAFGINDIGMAQFAKGAGGFQYQTLPTGGGSEQLLKVLSGDAHTAQVSAAPSMVHIESGAARPLMILSPSWPELEKQGIPKSQDLYGFTVRNLTAMVGPPGLPEEIRQKLEDALKAAMSDKAVIEQMDKLGERTQFKTGKEIHDEVVKVSAEHGAMIEALGKKK